MTSAPRHTKRRPKQVTPIVTWKAYPHEFAPIAALCLRWGASAQTVRKWIREGLLPGSRLGGWKVRAADARDFEEAQRFKAAG